MHVIKQESTNVIPLPVGLDEFISKELKEGCDYGKIEGYSKPTLLKPGAEKICRFLQLSIEYNVDHRLEDWDKGLFHYEVRVRIKQKGNNSNVTEGIGSCNTKEEQYANQNPYSTVNTVLKIAKKRALVDAVLHVSATSGVFTQDVEKLNVNTNLKGGEAGITKQQLKKIHQLVIEQGMNAEAAREMIKMMLHSTKLTKVQASLFIQDLLLLNQA